MCRWCPRPPNWSGSAQGAALTVTHLANMLGVADCHTDRDTAPRGRIGTGYPNGILHEAKDGRGPLPRWLRKVDSRPPTR
jgi:hypothetical protein